MHGQAAEHVLHRRAAPHFLQRRAGGGIAHDESTPMGLFMSAAHVEADAVGEALSRIHIWMRALGDPKVHLAAQLGGNVLEQGLDRAEVVVDGAAGDSGDLRQLADIHFADALLSEQTQRRVMDTFLNRAHGSGTAFQQGGWQH
ncbi:hypothetical protein D9M68_704010 [compost metagenome]